MEACKTNPISSRICELGTQCCETHHEHTGQHDWRQCTHCHWANYTKQFNVRKSVYPRLGLTVQQSMMLFWHGKDGAALYPARRIQPRKLRHAQGQPGTSTR